MTMSPDPPEEPDLDRAYQELMRLLLRGKFEATSAKPFRLLTAFITDLPHRVS